MQPQLQALADGIIPTITLKPLSRFKVPIPSLQIQTEIVETLDPFHALIHDLCQGIPGEIAGRKQQLKFLRTDEFKDLLAGCQQNTRRQRTASPLAAQDLAA